MLTRRIPLIFWYDPVGKRTLLDFVLSELEMLRPFVHTQTVLFDLRTNEHVQLQDIFPNHLLAFAEPDSPVVMHPRGYKADHITPGFARAHIIPMPERVDDPKIIELLLPDLKIAVAHSYSNGVDRPIRKAHSAAILIKRENQLEIVIAKNFRHPTIGYLARCSEAIGIAFAQSEGLFSKRHQIDHVVVYSPDYRSRDSSELHPPAVCGTCESVISSYSGDDPSGVLITTMSDTTQTHYRIMHGLYSRLEKVIV
jgi:cytidine deaminase